VLAAGRPGSGRPGGRHGRRPAPPGPGSRAAAGGPAGTQSALDAARERRGIWPGGRDNGRSAVGCRGPAAAPAPPARPFHAPAAAVRQGDRCLPGRGWGRGPCRNDTWTAAENHGKSGDPAESTHGAPVPQSVSRGIQAGRAATCRIRGSMRYRANHHGHSGAAMGWPFWLGQHGPIPGHQTRARFTRTVRRNRFCRVTGQAVDCDIQQASLARGSRSSESRRSGYHSMGSAVTPIPRRRLHPGREATPLAAELLQDRRALGQDRQQQRV
jgi:hypothetical protein